MLSFFSNPLSSWRQGFSNYLTSAANLLFLLIGLKMESREGWLISFGLVGATSLLAWTANLRRYRTVSDTPTSLVESAPQGYVELFGKGAQHDGFILTSRYSQVPCLWYRFRMEEQTSNDKWEMVESGSSEDTFLLKDNTGQCALDPDDAEIITTHKKSWREGSYRYTEYLLFEHDDLYAIGEHVTVGGANSPLNLKEDVNALLTEWKQDKPALLQRFDLNQDGEIDMKEWELARSAAVRQVKKHHAEIRLRDGIHMMRKPQDGRMYMISNLHPDSLSRRYEIWAWVHLFVLIAACGAAAYFWID